MKKEIDELPHIVLQYGICLFLQTATSLAQNKSPFSAQVFAPIEDTYTRIAWVTRSRGLPLPPAAIKATWPPWRWQMLDWCVSHQVSLQVRYSRVRGIISLPPRSVSRHSKPRFCKSWSCIWSCRTLWGHGVETIFPKCVVCSAMGETVDKREDRVWTQSDDDNVIKRSET